MRPRQRGSSRPALPAPLGYGVQRLAHVLKDLTVRRYCCARPGDDNQLHPLRKPPATSPIRLPDAPPGPIATNRAPDLPANGEAGLAPPRGLAPEEQDRWPFDPRTPLEDGLKLLGAGQPFAPRKGLAAHRCVVARR